MKTPKEYTKLINNGMVTEDILGEVLYSYNKRAKNYRDKKNEYRNRYDNYNNFEKNEEKEKEYYSKKEAILDFYNPIELHKDVKIKNNIARIYDEEGYGATTYNGHDYDYIREHRNEFNIKKFNYFQDRETYIQVNFVDIAEPCEINLYFLYYKIGDYTFHTPIQEEDIEKDYKDLEIINLEDFVTQGKDINDLLSVQFCDKVYERLINGELKIINKELQEA